MERSIHPESHYRVVRYHPHFGHGIFAEILGENLSLDDAKKLHEANKPVITKEDLVIEDQNKVGVDAEVLSYRKEEDQST